MSKSGELLSLINAGSTQIIHNGVNGRIFGTAPNQIFLPAVGTRQSSLQSSINNMLKNVNVEGMYWSSTRGGTPLAAFLVFGFTSTMDSDFFSSAHSVRCVADN